jgi:peptidyl-Asp metalloendopeptidase
VGRSRPILYGLLAIAGTAAAARADDRKARVDAATPAYTRADSVVSTSRGTHSILRPVTSGMRASKGQARHEQINLTTPTTVAAAQSITHKFALEPSAVIIDVLVAYTKGAASHYSDIKRELVDVAIEEANNSFRMSNLGHLRLRIVHVYRTDYVEEGQHFDHVWRFADKGDGYMDEVHGLRDLHRADLAVLIVDDAKGCGLATRVHADESEGFAVVHHECAAANYTMAHEIGHLIGARHELSYVNGTRWRDIMGSKESCGGCPRLPVWSSPTVLVNGEPAGTAELDNARVIAQEAGRVAAFR